MASNLTPDQRKLLRQILTKPSGAPRGSPKQQKAAVETAIVETNISNPSAMTDHDSQGWRQERASLYKDPTNVQNSAARFFKETAAVKGKYGRAGDLAAAVQRPAQQYRGRYQQHSAEADSILKQLGLGKGGSGSARDKLTGTTTTTNTSGVDNSGVRQQLLAQYLTGNKSSAGLVNLALKVRANQDVPGTSSTITTPGARKPAVSQPSSQPSVSGGPSAIPSMKGTASFEGKTVAAWIAPALKYARAHGWKGSVESGYRSFAEQTRIYNSGVRPAAVPGTSNHEGSDYPRGAIDVSQPQQLAQILARSPYGRYLKYAGAKDPVHFSHPHGGSY